MRRSASEIIRNLNSRVAKLERKASLNIKELLDLGIITKDQYKQGIQAERERMGGSNNLPKVGDILVASEDWNGIRSYFYEVIKVSVRDRDIWVQRLKTKVSDPRRSRIMPIPHAYNQRPEKKKFKSVVGGYVFNVGKYAGDAHIWDGTPQYFMKSFI